MAANTADGDTSVSITSAEADMTALLPTGAFTMSTSFTVRELDPVELEPEMGATTVVTPIAGHEFLFDVPTLSADAFVSFTVRVPALSAPDQASLVQALADGTATVAVKGDNAADVYQSFPVCAPGQSLSTGCAEIRALDALGNEVPSDGSVVPATLIFTVLTDHFSTYAVVIEGFLDADGDDIDNDEDNCPFDVNPDQLDTDGDGAGDACDEDDDDDGVLDVSDNCPVDDNPDQADSEMDGLGDACDTDDDNDGVSDVGDNCPFSANADQSDFDGDGAGDVCDADIDGDGIYNVGDNCVDVPNFYQTDTDGDSEGDACDDDDDNDGVLDVDDNCAHRPEPRPDRHRRRRARRRLRRGRRRGQHRRHLR